jgi:serine/threonine protein kinase
MNLDYLIGQKVGVSTLLRERARGSRAIIFDACQMTSKRRVAVKILPRTLLTPLAAELVHQEAEAAAILSHPNIATIHEVGETEDFIFVAMQLVTGPSLIDYLTMARKHVIPSKRFLPVKETVKIIIQVLGALDYAHRLDIVHRDIKPTNILIDVQVRRPIILDFGIAPTTCAFEGNSSMITGTPPYMAPEQILNKPVDRRADIYATGVMLFEMLVTNLPLPQCSTADEVSRMRLDLKEGLFHKKPSEINLSLHCEMDQIVFKALSHDPWERYANCDEFITELKAYQARHLRTQPEHAPM